MTYTNERYETGIPETAMYAGKLGEKIGCEVLKSKKWTIILSTLLTVAVAIALAVFKMRNT